MSAPPGLYEQVLAAAGGDLPPDRPPRPSAAVVPWRRRDGALEVYWIRRGRTLPFMGGWRAFPGGGLDRRDAALPVAGLPSHPSPERVTSPSALPVSDLEPDLRPGIVACALRELFEETGALLTSGRRPADLSKMRRDLLAGQLDFGRTLSEAGAALNAEPLQFAGRWLTPPFTPRRFDNRFFVWEWSTQAGDLTVAPPESESGGWIEPAAALAEIARGESMAAPPILHLLRVMAENGPEASTPRLLDTSEANLGPLRRIELRPGIVLLPLRAATLPPATHTNAFLLGTGECVLVDPGSPFEEENRRLLEALAAAERQLGRRVREIWLTHHHPDHVGGVEPVRRALGVPVAAHRETAERLAPHGIVVDRLLAGDQKVTLAGEPTTALRLHHTPGHARGHLAIEVEGQGDLVGGDLVAGFGTIVIDPPEGDMDDYLGSLERMRARGFRTLFPSHGAPLLDVEAKLTEYIDHRLDRERQVLAAWEGGSRDPAALVLEVYPEVPAAVRPLAERQLVAHLERLERQDRIRR